MKRSFLGVTRSGDVVCWKGDVVGWVWGMLWDGAGDVVGMLFHPDRRGGAFAKGGANRLAHPLMVPRTLTGPSKPCAESGATYRS